MHRTADHRLLTGVPPSTTTAAARPVATPLPGWPDPAEADFDAVGWRIGADHARCGLTPPSEHLHPHNPVSQGWRWALARWRRRSAATQSDVWIQRWLELRLQCWREGRIFDGLSVTPRTLARLDGGHCPVLRLPFGPGPQAPTPMVLYSGAACAAGNLALVSQGVAQVAAGLTLEQARLRAEDAPDESSGNTASTLSRVQWLRVASLMALASPMSFVEAQAMPLHLMPPVRCRVVNSVHALQVLLMLGLTPGHHTSPRCQPADWASRLPVESRRPFFQLASALVAFRLGAAAMAATERPLPTQGLADAWGDATVRQRWRDLLVALGGERCDALVRTLAHEVSSLKPTTRRPWRWLDDEAAIDGWALAQAGRLSAHGDDAFGDQRLKS